MDGLQRVCILVREKKVPGLRMPTIGHGDQLSHWKGKTKLYCYCENRLGYGTADRFILSIHSNVGCSSAIGPATYLNNARLCWTSRTSHGDGGPARGHSGSRSGLWCQVGEKEQGIDRFRAFCFLRLAFPDSAFWASYMRIRRHLSGKANNPPFVKTTPTIPGMLMIK